MTTVALVHGGTTYTLSGDGATFAGCTYAPLVDGTQESDGQVAETCWVVLSGTPSAIRTAVQALEKALQDARRYDETGIGRDVHVHYTSASGEATYRSRLRGGRIWWSTDPLERAMVSGVVRVALVWIRDAWWEATSSVELPLSNSNGSNVTGGLTIYNHNDGDAGHDNYVDIAGNDVQGVLPAPIRLEMINSSGSAIAYGHVYIGHTFHGIALYPVIEGEVGGYPDTSDVASSGGAFTRLSLPGSRGQLWTHALQSADVDVYAGRPVAVMARFANNPPAATYVRVRLTRDGVVLAESPEIQLGLSKLQLLGVVRIPPGLEMISGSGALNVELYGYNVGGGDLDLDFVHLMPTDSFRRLRSLATGAPTISYDANGTLVDDGIVGERPQTYWRTSGGVLLPTWTADGEPIRLWPGRDQRLYFLHDEQLNDSQIAHTWSVRIWYRPRRLTI